MSPFALQGSFGLPFKQTQPDLACARVFLAAHLLCETFPVINAVFPFLTHWEENPISAPGDRGLPTSEACHAWLPDAAFALGRQVPIPALPSPSFAAPENSPDLGTPQALPV